MIMFKNISKQQKAKLIFVLILTSLALKIDTQLQRLDNSNSIHYHKLYPKLHCKTLLIDLHIHVFLPLVAQ